MWALPRLTLLLLMFLPDPLHASSISPLSSRPPVTHVRVVYVTGIDYDYESETPEPPHKPRPAASTPTPRLSQPCDYDPCVAQEIACSKISAETGCLCPGLSGPKEPPESPRLSHLNLFSSGEVGVHWCAPSSTVTHYKIVMEGQGNSAPVFTESSRNATLRGIKVGTKICIVAVNDVGSSEESKESCSHLEPQKPEMGALKIGVIAGGIGFLVLLSLAALVIWQRKSCRKGGTSDVEGLRNPSYSTDATL